MSAMEMIQYIQDTRGWLKHEARIGVNGKFWYYETKTLKTWGSTPFDAVRLHRDVMVNDSKTEE